MIRGSLNLWGEDRLYILVVEDDPSIREVIREVLGVTHHTVRMAKHGRDALDIISHGAKPDLILLDLMMPVIDGWQLIEILSEDSKLSKIPVVVMSAVASSDHMKAHPNAVGMISKPLEIDSLLDVVEQFCGEILSSEKMTPGIRKGDEHFKAKEI